MQGPTPRVLCTEDHSDTRDLIRFVLAAEGFEVTCAESPHHAIYLAQNQQFDLYLLDNWTPGTSGVELCEKLREFDPHTPILFFSSGAYEADKQRAFNCGAQEYLTKPADGDVLTSKVRGLIAKSKRSQAGREG